MPRSTRQELALGLYFGLVWSLAVAAILNNPLESSTRTWFVALGAANELIGVLMIASPELLPLVAALARVMATRTRAAMVGLRRIVRRLFHRTHRVSAQLTIGTDIGTSVEDALVTRKLPGDATSEELIAWLLAEHQRQDDRIVALETRQAAMPSEWKREIAEVKRAAEEHAQTLVRSLADRHLSLRLLGLGYVVLGVILSTVGNLV
jgi:hypothetical protein